jgi:hypothetical protein
MYAELCERKLVDANLHNISQPAARSRTTEDSI